jgi:ABC-type glutathione transport system ATPase component
MTADALLTVSHLRKSFGGGRRGRGAVQAVRDVSFSVRRGEVLGLAGESGSGKSTCVRLILRLTEPDDGSITFDGIDVRALRRQDLAAVRRRMSLVSQDPYSSLDPTWEVRDLVTEALLGRAKQRERHARAAQLLDHVRLDRSFLQRRPRELSGGQRQRVAVARALALTPELVILDEAVSALDVSTRAQILQLLQTLQTELGLTYLFVSHDLSVLQQFTDVLSVQLQGQTVETGPTADLCENPRHPYVKRLLASVPVPDPQAQRLRREALLDSTDDMGARS